MPAFKYSSKTKINDATFSGLRQTGAAAGPQTLNKEQTADSFALVILFSLAREYGTKWQSITASFDFQLASFPAR